MGAEQSSNRSANGQSANTVVRKTCYYELMGIERTATEDEIRKAYKRKALELHPDRNFNDVENATRKFAEVQTAYEILSDPQERAWYDSHRDAILSGDPDGAGAGDGAAPSQYNNIRITTAEEIYSLMGRFNSNVPMNDSPNGFFAILDEFFGHLADEEAAACEWDGLEPPEYPPFGSSTDDYDAVARPFYNAWSSFATRKSFSWRDKYRLSDAPDRRVRRLMEKENKKSRDDGIRDFNDAVRSLAAFVKKRDPRYVPNTQSEAERQRVLRDSAAAQAARSRAANQEKLAAYVLPDWAQARNENEADPHEGEFSDSEDESEVEEIECVVCAKTFKSEKQFEAHEKSKKHQKAVQQLRRQMKRENLDLDLDEDDTAAEVPAASGANFVPAPGKDLGESAKKGDPSSQTTQGSKDAPETTAKPSREGSDESSSQADSLDDEYASRDEVENRITGAAGGSKAPLNANKVDDVEATSAVEQLTLDDTPGAKKVGKARQKREKKAARQAALEEQGASHACNICRATFPSRTKMFAHIEEEHSAPKHSKGKKSKR
ncbi:uncharacterized protein PgNI_00432 [Pyricularia grisea]|uniref:J domain-containing protein n=1 Tax=Pyricularia grisea TaxID=148305 RepID=A0A6P8BLZ2_PYRGI|nr:uncharacterized protein PgNI_00432 [Pyricularia grisea]TLD17724.1 hypothetical protein PgNI_00432 [Pyricularia grisea]